MPFDQRSPQPLDVVVLRWRKQTDRQTDEHGNSMTKSAKRVDSVKILWGKNSVLKIRLKSSSGILTFLF